MSGAMTTPASMIPISRKASTGSCFRQVRERPKRQGLRRGGQNPGGPATHFRRLPWAAGRRRGVRGRRRSSAGLLHGKTSLIHHHGIGVLAGLPSPFTATRYHSLAIEPATLPAVLEVTATTPSGVIMAYATALPVEAVQFHPESVLTEWGYQMLANWLVICGDAEAPARAVGMAPPMSAR